MSRILTTLLCVGVQLILTSGVQEPLPQPHIQAVPDSLILKGEPVTIQCSAPTIAENYLIWKKEVSEDGETTQTVNSRTLTISQMTTQNVGLYICSYERGHIWSPPSQPLTLVMTDAPSTGPSRQPAWSTETRDPLLHIEHPTHPADPHNLPTFKGSEFVTDSLGHPGTTEPRATTDSPEHTTITEPGVTDANTRTLHTQIPGASPGPSAESPNFLKQYWGVMIGALTAFILLLIFFLLVLRHRRARKNTQKQAGAAYQPPDAQNLREVTYSQVTCTVTIATKPTLQPEAKATSEYATLALR